MRKQLAFVVALAACGGGGGGSAAPDASDYCPNGDCIAYLCECGSASCASTAPQTCGSDADCPTGDHCNADFDDTPQCSPTCRPEDGSVCPTGYTCKTFAP